MEGANDNRTRDQTQGGYEIDENIDQNSITQHCDEKNISEQQDSNLKNQKETENSIERNVINQQNTNNLTLNEESHPKTDDEFEDFEDFSSAPIKKVEENKNVDVAEEFDDFEDFSTAPPPGQSQSNVPQQQENFKDLEIIKSLIDIVSSPGNDKSNFLREVEGVFNTCFAKKPSTLNKVENNNIEGLLVEAGEDSAELKGKLIIPNPSFNDDPWYALWKQLDSETSYSEAIASKFRWKRSHSRKMFLKSLDLQIEEINNQKITAQINQSQEVFTNNSPLGKKERELEYNEAKRLAEISEEEVSRKTTDELKALIKTLSAMTHKIQDQANYWLDAKEQLVMDAEMHNKMIASLVQYAQQQQVKGPSRSKSPNKKGVARR
ncbi:hypothetical protein HDU92_007598 [Lobulomyces angularis]|nr:hypothetical protein HDU92_007598 [Lobulomyces angularis]